MSSQRLLFNIAPNMWDKKKKKPRTLTGNKRIISFELAQKNGIVKCSICHRPIYSVVDAEPDHTRAYCKGGTTMRWSHRACNRAKGRETLGKFQKEIGVRTKKRKRTKRKKKRRASAEPSIFGNLFKPPKGGQQNPFKW